MIEEGSDVVVRGKTEPAMSEWHICSNCKVKVKMADGSVPEKCSVCKVGTFHKETKTTFLTWVCNKCENEVSSAFKPSWCPSCNTGGTMVRLPNPGAHRADGGSVPHTKPSTTDQEQEHKKQSWEDHIKGLP